MLHKLEKRHISQLLFNCFVGCCFFSLTGWHLRVLATAEAAAVTSGSFLCECA